ncbi:MAG: hypothetical protein MZV63_69235 [Marinilabiliales bacterium]|nr:hypothetical protein [Marinilabiliales bacterium]
MQKKLQTLSEEEQQKIKQAELNAKKREMEIRKKIAEIEGDAEKLKRSLNGNISIRMTSTRMR